MMIEEFKNIKNYEGYYQVSNFGNVRSLDRKVEYIDGRICNYKGKMLALCSGEAGYLSTVFYMANKPQTNCVHRLVWDTFGDKKRNGHLLQVDHIDNNKLNNRIDNLQLLSTRENCSKEKVKHNKYSSRYVGVYYRKRTGLYESQIKFNGKIYSLGGFENEIDAHHEYQLQLNNITLMNRVAIVPKRKKTSLYKGVSFCVPIKKWRARYKGYLIGTFTREVDAYFEYKLRSGR